MYKPILKMFFTLSLLSFPISSTLLAQDIKMVEIPSGSFYMGSKGEGEDYDEAPIHKVIISHSFRMGETEITNRQYEIFRPEHSKLRGKNGVSTEDDDAVVNVSYNDALEYCRWLSKKENKNYRLPTEAEWEYACRAGTYTQYYTGDGIPSSMSRNQTIARDYKPVSLKVGVTPPNSFGLYDMHGNVEEWCMDWYGAYSSEEEIDPVGPANGEYRVTRGGSHNTPARYLRSANRMAMIPEDKHSLTGFRVVESEISLVSNAIDKEKAYFLEPIPFVIEPKDKSVPFYSHNHQPSVTWCDNGDIIAAWFSANEENGRGMVVLSSRLRKGADSWEPAQLFYKVPDRNMTGTSIFNNKKGEIYHFNGVEAAGDWQNLMVVMRKSNDNGFTWSQSKIIAAEHSKRHQIISGTSYTSKEWILQACDAGPDGNAGTALLISKDGGISWKDEWDGAVMPDFSQGKKGTTIAGIHAGVVGLKDGSIMALGRGNSIKNNDGINKMPMSISQDGGRSWTYSASEFPPIDGGQRLILMRLNEGPILLVSFTDHPQRTSKSERGMLFTNSDGTTYKGYGMYAALSYDDGKSWKVKKLLTDGKERFLDGGAWTGNFIMDKNNAEPRGYLAAVQSPDGMIHIVSSRLHYRFNLKWLEE